MSDSQPYDMSKTLQQRATLRESDGVRRPSAERSDPSLVVFHLENTWVRRLAEGVSLVVGRDPTAEIPIMDASVSRRHAKFANAGGVITVSDLGSTNGTRLNGQVVQQAVMGFGDEVTVGNVTVTMHVRAPWRSPSEHTWSHDQFLGALEDEVDRARTFSRGFSVASVRAPEAASIIPLIREKQRPVDRLAHFGDGTLEWLLPEMSAAEVSALLATLPVHAGVASYPADGSSSEALLEASRAAMRLSSHAKPVQLATAPAAVASSDLVCVSPAMCVLFDTVGRVANAVIPVLIRGETGTGKEVLARAIHERGPRAHQRLVAINCAAIPATLLESVLFGHERGAFTGAQTANPGVFEEADGGTVLLDEVGELTPAAQAALLRVLETRTVRRVGANREVAVDVRVIAATHRDVEAMVSAGTFREDLLYRLNTMTLEVPPLRERPEEIGPLAERFRELANAANGRQVSGISPDAMRVLLRHAWPGNIRELRNAIEHAVVVARGSLIAPEDLPRRTREFAATVLQRADDAPEPQPTDLREGMARYETQLILEALRATRGNRTEAARRLQIPVRTLSHKIRQYGIKKLGFGLEEQGED